MAPHAVRRGLTGPDIREIVPAARGRRGRRPSSSTPLVRFSSPTTSRSCSVSAVTNRARITWRCCRRPSSSGSRAGSSASCSSAATRGAARSSSTSSSASSAEGRPVSTIAAVTDELLWSAYRSRRVHGVSHRSTRDTDCRSPRRSPSGTPVVTSNFGSMQEIAAQGGALLVNPRDDDGHRRSDRRSRVRPRDQPARLRHEATRASHLATGRTTLPSCGTTSCPRVECNVRRRCASGSTVPLFAPTMESTLGITRPTSSGSPLGAPVREERLVRPRDPLGVRPLGARPHRPTRAARPARAA